MIINLWSTPRTGSVWYSLFLRHQNPNSVLVTEMFNRYHMNIYHSRSNIGSVTNHHEYADGLYYKEFYLENGFLKSKEIFSRRIRNIEEQENYVLDLLHNVDNSQTLIMHNHVDPINPDIRKELMRIGENIFIYRKDKRKQLASYAIAFATKQFAAFNKLHVKSNLVNDNDVDIGSLENLVRRIKVWDSIPKDGCQIIAYEDIKFLNLPNFPVKQNTEHEKRLSSNMLNIINNLILEYERK